MTKKIVNKYNQYFTNDNIASFMSSLFTISQEQKEISILDPGAGEGNLSIATVNYVVHEYPNIKKIQIIAYEIDEKISVKLKERYKEVAYFVKEKFNVILEFRIVLKNYLYCLEDKISVDLAIINPPYGKIKQSSNVSVHLEASGYSRVNYYSSFIEVAMGHLKKEGQLVSIIPRSFMNGTYFKVFRGNVFAKNSVTRIHIFQSRYLFDKVIQENVVLKLNKTKQKKNAMIEISCSTDESFSDMEIIKTTRKNVIDENRNYLMKVSLNVIELEIRKIIEKNGLSLDELQGLRVSTGPIVDFREEARLISKKLTDDAVPYIFQDHIRENYNDIIWPLEEAKKGNYLRITEKNISRLREVGNYVVVRRFSPKEARHRVNAAFIPGNSDYKFYAFDNKVNYYHVNKKGISEEIAIGLSLYLNSSLVEIFIKQISGSTQINTSDLASLKYPDLYQMENMGNLWKKFNFEYNQLNINKVVASSILNWEN